MDDKIKNYIKGLLQSLESGAYDVRIFEDTTILISDSKSPYQIELECYEVNTSYANFYLTFYITDENYVGIEFGTHNSDKGISKIKRVVKEFMRRGYIRLRQ